MKKIMTLSLALTLMQTSNISATSIPPMQPPANTIPGSLPPGMQPPAGSSGTMSMGGVSIGSPTAMPPQQGTLPPGVQPSIQPPAGAPGIMSTGTLPPGPGAQQVQSIPPAQSMTMHSSGPVLAGSTAEGTLGMLALSTATAGLPIYMHSKACSLQCKDPKAGGKSLYQIATSPNQNTEQLAVDLSNIAAVRCMLFCSRLNARPTAIHHINFIDNLLANFLNQNGEKAAPDVDKKAIEILGMAMSGREDGDSPADTLLHRYLAKRKKNKISHMTPRAKEIVEGLRVFHCGELARTKTHYVLGPDCHPAAPPVATGQPTPQQTATPVK